MNVNLNMSSHRASFLVRQKHPLMTVHVFFCLLTKTFFNLHVSVGGERNSLGKLISFVCKSQHFKLKINFIILLKYTFHYKIGRKAFFLQNVYILNSVVAILCHHQIVRTSALVKWYYIGILRVLTVKSC